MSSKAKMKFCLLDYWKKDATIMAKYYITLLLTSVTMKNAVFWDLAQCGFIII
jgi:hypothetical protein